MKMKKKYEINNVHIYHAQIDCSLTSIYMYLFLKVFTLYISLLLFFTHTKNFFLLIKKNLLI